MVKVIDLNHLNHKTWKSLTSLKNTIRDYNKNYKKADDQAYNLYKIDGYFLKDYEL